MKNKSENIKVFRENYDKNLTIDKNREILKTKGLDISKATCSRWIERYIGTISIEVPVCFEEEMKNYLKRLMGE